MRHEYDNARRHAENTIAEANRHLNSGRVRNPKHHQMLTAMIKDATDTIRNLDTSDDTRPYSNTNIGFRTDSRQRRTHADTTDLINDAMDLVDRILPHISDDDRYNLDMRRGVPGTGRARRVRRVRADNYNDDDYSYNDDRYDADDDRYDDIDDLKVVNMPRWRSARTGRFLPNLYGPRRVRRVRRRAEMDNMDDRYDDVRYDADDRYDDNRYNRQDDARTRADHERRMHDAVARAAADAAVNTARRMTNNTRSDMPVMTHNDTRNDARYDADTTADRPGPGMRR